MKRGVLLCVVIVSLFLYACNDSTSASSDNDVPDSTTDVDVEDVVNDDISDSDACLDEDADIPWQDDEDILPDEDVPQMLQRGAVSFFSEDDQEDQLSFSFENRVPGNGGFFGYTMKDLGEYVAIGALHESEPPFDFEKAAGAL